MRFALYAFAQANASRVHLLDARCRPEAQPAFEVGLDDVLRVLDRALRARVARLVHDELDLQRLSRLRIEWAVLALPGSIMSIRGTP
jgi:hypothetical protein